MKLLGEVAHVFAAVPDTDASSVPNSRMTEISGHRGIETGADMQPELVLSPASRNWTTLDLVVTIHAVKLHLYDAQAHSEDTLKDHGIARFALNNNTLRLKTLSHGASEIEIVLESFTMSNTRPGASKFREIIPAAQHNRNQFMLLYTMSGGPQATSLAVLTIDSPQIIFAIDPIMYLLEFFTSPFSATVVSAPPQIEESTSTIEPQQGSQFDFRLNLHDVSISVLEDDADHESRAIRLHIAEILLS